MLIDQPAAFSRAGMYWPTYGNDTMNTFTYRITALIAEPETISEAVGGVVDFWLNAGLANAGRNYIMLGSLTGTSPGTPLPGGNVTLPLNWDVFTGLIINLVNTPVFPNFIGVLDSAGKAHAQFDTLGPIPGTAGLSMYFAFALANPWDFASNPVTISIVL